MNEPSEEGSAGNLTLGVHVPNTSKLSVEQTHIYRYPHRQHKQSASTSMPPKKGMTIEEKQCKLLKWFQDEHTMYTIKEVESIASKRTGISSMQIKDILKMLIDDGLVQCEKCGISNIYWSFQYTGIMKLNSDFERLKSKKELLMQNIADAKAKLEALQNERKMDPEKRGGLLSQVKELEISNTEISNQIKKMLESSPEKVKQKEDNLVVIQTAIDTMHENLDILVSFIYDANPSGLSKTAIREYFGIPDEE